MSVLYLITARSGSKAIPNKNVKILNGKPLLAYRLASLPNYEGSCVWLSTDSLEYVELAKSYGLESPFLRPKHLANDDSSSVEVVLHAMNFAESQGLKFDLIALIEPTSPFVSKSSLRDAIELLTFNSEATGIVSVKENRPNTFFVQKKGKYLDVLASRMGNRENLGRQNFETEVTPSGGFYISKWNDFITNKTFYTKSTLQYMLTEEEELEIDEPIDFELAKAIINMKHGK